MQLAQINIYHLIKKNLSLESLLFIGGGLKIFGHAFLDEIALWLFIIKNSKNNFKNGIKFNIDTSKIDFRTITLFLLTLHCLIALLFIKSSFKFEAIRMFIFFILMFYLSYSGIFKKINLSQALFGSYMFLIISLYFGLNEIYQRVTNELNSNCFVTNNPVQDCTYFTAYWQDKLSNKLKYLSWVGTAYAAPYLFLSNLLIIKHNKNNYQNFFYTTTHIIIGI